MKINRKNDYIIETYDEFLERKYGSNDSIEFEPIDFAAIGAGIIAHRLHENEQSIDEDTYLLSYMTQKQIDECIDAFYNYEKVCGYQPEFFNECIDAFFEISNEVWENHEGYITEGYDKDDTSIIEEEVDLVACAAENINRIL